MTDDCLIVGAGVIGLSLAYDLSRHGKRVRVLERGEPAREASWAGAGILPPAKLHPDSNALDRLAALSHPLHPQWAAMLQAETGIDNGYRACGGVYVAHDNASATELHSLAEYWSRCGVAHQALSHAEARRQHAALAAAECAAIYFTPEEAQIRNPWHLQALLAGCHLHDVQIHAGAPAESFLVHGDRIVAVRTPRGDFTAEQFCITGGAWTAGLMALLGVSLPLRPVRGQIVLVRQQTGVFDSVINEGRRYLVPRSDGRVLIGATEEDGGFEKRTTAGATIDLLQFATRLVPALRDAEVERSWAGLRPATVDGKPYLGRIPNVCNGYVAAGHFRAGLELSPATAVVMGQLMRDEPTSIDLAEFDPARMLDRPVV